VNKLIVSLKTRFDFGALSTVTQPIPPPQRQRCLREAPGEVAANWWDEPFIKRTRIEVDMPGGMAEIRGSFWNNSIYSMAHAHPYWMAGICVYQQRIRIAVPRSVDNHLLTKFNAFHVNFMNLTERIAFQNAQVGYWDAPRRFRITCRRTCVLVHRRHPISSGYFRCSG
jgi:hypothetical protein